MNIVPARTPVIILASQSPRRAAILDALGVQYVVSVSDAEEEATFPTDDQTKGIPYAGVPRNDQPARRPRRNGSHLARLHPVMGLGGSDTDGRCVMGVCTLV